MTNKLIHPVVVFLYKRPERTQELLHRISNAGIKKIYIFADGPKTSLDYQLTEDVKTIVLDFISTHQSINCLTSFSRTNLGLQRSIYLGITQVLRHESSAIVLEDDCLPSPDFFPFMTAMLAKFAHTPQVLSVTGTSIGEYSPFSYDFSRYQLCWGWGTWKRAWQLYETKLDTTTHSSIAYSNSLAKWYWQNIFKLINQGIIKTWDYQWTFAHFAHDGLAIVPSVNLVTNLGFDQKATNTNFASTVANLPHQSLHFPLVHPSTIVENKLLTKAIEKKFYLHPIALLGLIKYLFISRFRRLL